MSTSRQPNLPARRRKRHLQHQCYALLPTDNYQGLHQRNARLGETYTDHHQLISLFGAVIQGLTQHGIHTPQRRYGNAVLSRYPVLATRAIDLSFGAREARGALDADLDCHGQALRVVATHLGLRPAERRHQIRRLLQAFDTDRMAVILMGDVNEWFVWGRSLRWLVSHFEAAPAPRTFPARWPLLSLDRIWISPRRRFLHVRVYKSALARMASDHLPLVAHIDG